MGEPLNDRPNVIVFPPLIILATLVIACALQWLIPLRWLAHIDQAWRIGAGILIAMIGAPIMIGGRRSLMRRGTNVNPSLPSTALATDGIYRWTRNPMYVGVTALMIAVALIFALDWLLLLLVPSFLLLHFGVVAREERYLERKFGDEYRRYKAGVRRYVWPV